VLYAIFRTIVVCGLKSEVEHGGHHKENILGGAVAGDSHVVVGGGGNGGDIEGDVGGPEANGISFLDVGVLVVSEGAENSALEVDVVELNVLNPDTTEGEGLSLAKSWWVGGSVGLAVIHDEPGLVVSLGDDEAVGDGGGHGLSEVGDVNLGEGLVETGLNEGDGALHLKNYNSH